MAKKIGTHEGGAGLTAGHSDKRRDSFEDVLKAYRDEIDDLRSKYASLLAKLDADTGVNDTDFASTLPLGAKQVIK